MREQIITIDPVCTLELLAIKIFPNRPLAPATEKSYGEVGVLLATGFGGPKNFHKLCRTCRCYGRGLWQKGLP
jgi:hypothetical protein